MVKLHAVSQRSPRSSLRPLVKTFRHLFLWAAVASTLTACDRTKTQSAGCSQDSDCGSPASAYRCDVPSGVCYCRTDDACAARQFCNALGYCQDKSGCQQNSDCLGSNLYCDTTSGTCVSKGRCSNDLQCEMGQVCDQKKSLCVPGCRTNGDCNGTSCRCGNGPCICNGTTPEELANCQLGVCDETFCADNTFCKFGEKCGVLPDAGTELAQCYSDFDPNRRPYCGTCNFGAGMETCGTGANYCLIDTAHPGSYYCGTDCSQGQTCPRGYACQDVIVVMTQWECTRSKPFCKENTNKPCTENKDCPRGGECLKAAGATDGFCAPKCNIDEGDEKGFCTCLVDSDCAQESCSQGECSISRRKCTIDDDCRSIRCVDFQGAGGCLIGQNCAPSDGLSCLEVK